MTFTKTNYINSPLFIMNLCCLTPSPLMNTQTASWKLSTFAELLNNSVLDLHTNFSVGQGTALVTAHSSLILANFYSTK